MDNTSLRIKSVLLWSVTVGWGAGMVPGSEFDFERPPIDYQTAPATDRVARLRDEIRAGRVSMLWDRKYGWLPSLLEQLHVPIDSQTLVFSKTSLQLRKIAPETPRALYFNDDVYIGWVQQGDKLEIAAVDPYLGAVFYTVPQQNSQPPRFVRDQGECLSCHATPKTQNVPGLLVRSVFPSAEGQPILTLGSITTDHRTDFAERFGGWYVTGTHGPMRHRGNVIANEQSDPPIDVESGANCVDLAGRIEITPYLTKHSDLVALMVLEHQSQMHNAITQANYVARQAYHYDEIMNRVLERDANFHSDSTKRRIQAASENLLEHALLVGEQTLTHAVRGTSEFADHFADTGIKDAHGRSLKDLDLQRRLFRYPCSFLVQSDSFAALPEPILERFRIRLSDVLQGRDASDKFRHLSNDDRRNIYEILSATAPTWLQVEPTSATSP